MAKTVNPDKGKSIDTYRAEKITSPWQQAAFDQIKAIIEETYPAIRASIKWAQPVWETAEGPVMYARSSAKHFTLGFWRGAEMQDPTAVLEGEGDRMKHLKFKSLDDVNVELIRGFVTQAVALNARLGDPTKGK